MKRFYKTSLIVISLVFAIVLSLSVFCSCKKTNEPKTIKVYDVQTKQVSNMNFDEYLEGVVIAEIGESAPLEALKTQAVLARTFALNFIKNNKSKYEGADISNDITEAQAFSKKSSSEVKKAVSQTKGKVIKSEGEYINSYFFSNSGGTTALADEGFGLSSQNPPYLKSVQSPENSENSNNYKWTATLSKNQILQALRSMGLSVANISSFKKGEIGQSGRCTTFVIGGKEVSATTFRLAIGGTILKSTLIDDISLSASSVTISGRGYGHGTGLSQEGAIVLANQGKTFEEILNYYFQNIQIVNE